MWNPFKAWMDHRERMARIKAEAAAVPFNAMVQAVESQSQILKEWLEGFKSTEVSTRHIVRDQDEFDAEQDRERIERAEAGDRWQAIAFPKIEI